MPTAKKTAAPKKTAKKPVRPVKVQPAIEPPPPPHERVLADKSALNVLTRFGELRSQISTMREKMRKTTDKRERAAISFEMAETRAEHDAIEGAIQAIALERAASRAESISW